MIGNLLDLSVNLRILKIVGILLKLGYTTSQLKSLAGRSQE